ncbi:MAG: hypothetical protein AB7U63_16265 [Porticoccaceae bacterium]
MTELARGTKIMQKLFDRAISCLFMVIFLFPQPVYCAEQDPVQFITEFYTWYIPCLDALNNNDIYNYIAHDTIEEIKKISVIPGYDRIDYFIKLSNFPSNMNGVSILVNPVKSIGPDTLVTIVTIVYIDKFGHHFPDGVIVVIVKKIEGKLKIFKCIDTYPEA